MVFLREVREASGRLRLPVQLYLGVHPPNAAVIDAAVSRKLIKKSDGFDVMMGEFYRISLTVAGYRALGEKPPGNRLMTLANILSAWLKRRFTAV